MIKELENKYIFKENDPLYKTYFDKRKKTAFEIRKLNILRKKVVDFKTFSNSKDIIDNDFIDYNYLSNYGYYKMYEYDNEFEIVNYGEDYEVAFNKIIIEELFNLGLKYKLPQSMMNKYDFSKRFPNLEYFNSFSIVEFSLRKWSLYYHDELPQEIKDFYSTFLNKMPYSKDNNLYWFINQSNKLSCIDKTKTLSLNDFTYLLLYYSNCSLPVDYLTKIKENTYENNYINDFYNGLIDLEEYTTNQENWEEKFKLNLISNLENDKKNAYYDIKNNNIIFDYSKEELESKVSNIDKSSTYLMNIFCKNILSEKSKIKKLNYVK